MPFVQLLSQICTDKFRRVGAFKEYSSAWKLHFEWARIYVYVCFDCAVLLAHALGDVCELRGVLHLL